MKLTVSIIFRKGIADEHLAKLEQERGRKRDRQSEDPEVQGASKRVRSASDSSVSTISTGISRSPPPLEPSRGTAMPRPRHSDSPPPSPQSRSNFEQNSKFTNRSHSPPPEHRVAAVAKKRRRNSASSVDSYSSEGDSMGKLGSREERNSRSTRRRFKQSSPPMRGRRTESRSPHRRRRPLSNDRQRTSNQDNGHFTFGGPSQLDRFEGTRGPPRKQSLSPFSKRLALTKAMNRNGG